MSAVNVKKDVNALSANWQANLLIKDQSSGKLKRLRFQNYPNRLKELLEEEEEDRARTAALLSEETLKLAAPAGETAVKIAPAVDRFQPVPLAHRLAPSAKAELHFHPEDKEQVESLAAKVPLDDSRKYSLEKIVDTLLAKQDWDLDKDNKEKFGSIIFDFFRNRKRFLNVRELLLTTVRTRQGLRPEERVVDAVLSIVKGLKAKVEAAGGLVVRGDDVVPAPIKAPMPAPSPVQVPISPAPVEEVVKAKVAPVVPSAPAPEPQREITAALQEIKKEFPQAVIVEPAPPAQPKPKLDISIPTEAKSPAAPEIKVKLEEKPKAGVVTVAPVSAAAKKAVSDVVSRKEVVFKPVPQARHVLTGPVGELEAMTLDNFRRLGADSKERTERLLDKIDVLQHDSFSKKAQGITAWRRSETHQLYLQLGLASLQSGQEVRQIIAQKEKAGEKTLSADEFAAISDLNKKLRF